MFGHQNDACRREIKMPTASLECIGEQSATEHSIEVDAQTSKEEIVGKNNTIPYLPDLWEEYE